MLRRNLLRTGVVALTCVSAAASDWAPRRRPRLNVRTWAAYYGRETDLEQIGQFDLVVLEPDVERPIAAVRGDTRERPRRRKRRLALAYLSLGEIHETRGFFPEMAAAGVILGPHPTWAGSHYADLRNPIWREMVVQRLAANVMAQGYDGLFLDTLDTPLHLEASDASLYAGLSEAATTCVSDLRLTYPKAFIMMNRGYGLLPAVGMAIDALLAESLLTTYDHSTAAYRWTTPAELDQHLALLADFRQGPGAGPVFTLDYWRADDPATIKDIYAQERRLGHIPYVATIGLDALIPEPRA